MTVWCLSNGLVPAEVDGSLGEGATLGRRRRGLDGVRRSQQRPLETGDCHRIAQALADLIGAEQSAGPAGHQAMFVREALEPGGLCGRELAHHQLGLGIDHTSPRAALGAAQRMSVTVTPLGRGVAGEGHHSRRIHGRVNGEKGTHLREEDELGFGQWMKGARKSIYGSERILDAPIEVRRDFLTSMGLDCGVKIKCYVEGETELGALTSAAGDGAGAEFVNLRGQVTEGKGKGLSFAASLKNDKKSHVFSVVLLDCDREDNVRALKKAAKDGTFFGRFFIASPDFELANFTIDELVDVVITLNNKSNEILKRDDIKLLTNNAKSGKEFFSALGNANIYDLNKSMDWGIALMAYALKHPNLPQGHRNAGSIRPMIEAARLIVNARRSGYLRSLQRYNVDPETGELCEK